MRDECLELGKLDRFGKFFEVPITDEQFQMVNGNRPIRVINQKVQDWRMGRRPDNPFTSDPRSTVCMSPPIEDYTFARRNS